MSGRWHSNFESCKREFAGWKNRTHIRLTALAGPLAKLGEPEKLVKMLSTITRLMSELGLAFHPYDLPMIKLYREDAKALLYENTFALAWAVGQLMTYEQAVDYALGEYL